jgi:hypothetical protein
MGGVFGVALASAWLRRLLITAIMAFRLANSVANSSFDGSAGRASVAERVGEV